MPFRVAEPSAAGRARRRRVPGQLPYERVVERSGLLPGVPGGADFGVTETAVSAKSFDAAAR